ncbi:hypothetical protein Tco_0025848 [Tanacetum coccineum]
MVAEVETPYEPTSVEEKIARRNEMKARGTLLMALPNKDQIKFHQYKDAKLLMEAIMKRLQNIIGQLETRGEVLRQEDMNLKLLRSLPTEWKTHALIWRNKAEIETISLDDLYNNLKIYEREITGSSTSSKNSQNMAFVSSSSTKNSNSIKKADTAAYEINTANTQVNAANTAYVDNLSDAVICAFLANVDALLKASPGVNPASSDLFMGEYLKLFEMHYPYVDKVTRAYLLDPSELQNVMPDGTGPTPGGRPHPSPTAHS